MSCSGPPTRIASMRARSAPTASASRTASAVTRAAWPASSGSRDTSVRVSSWASPMRLTSFTARDTIPAGGSGALDDPVPPVPERQEEQGSDNEEPDHPVEAVVADRVRDRLAGDVGEHRDADGPDDAAGGVPHEEPPPRHVADAREPCGRHTQDRDETTEEDGLRAMLLEESLRRWQCLVGVAPGELPTVDQSAAPSATEPVADVVADDRSRRRDDDHRDERPPVV